MRGVKNNHDVISVFQECKHHFLKVEYWDIRRKGGRLGGKERLKRIAKIG